MIFISSLLSAWNELMKFSQRLQKMELSLLSLSLELVVLNFLTLYQTAGYSFEFVLVQQGEEKMSSIGSRYAISK